MKRGRVSSPLQFIKMAVDFLAEMAVDQVKITARFMAHLVTVQRALWLKHWAADNTSKHSLCSVPFDGKLLFLVRLWKQRSRESQGASRPRRSVIRRQNPQTNLSECVSTQSPQVGARLAFFEETWVEEV